METITSIQPDQVNPDRSEVPHQQTGLDQPGSGSSTWDARPLVAEPELPYVAGSDSNRDIGVLVWSHAHGLSETMPAGLADKVSQLQLHAIHKKFRETHPSSAYEDAALAPIENLALTADDRRWLQATEREREQSRTRGAARRAFLASIAPPRKAADVFADEPTAPAQATDAEAWAAAPMPVALKPSFVTHEAEPKRTLRHRTTAVIGAAARSLYARTSTRTDTRRPVGRHVMHAPAQRQLSITH